MSVPFPFAVFGTQHPLYPGSTALFNNTISGLTQLTLAMNNGGLFDLNSIDLTSLNGVNNVTVNFSGVKADSSVVTQSFTTDAILGTLETFNFSNFTNLTSVSWTQDRPFHQFDNINVTGTAIPEPLTILGAGTALGFGTFFKRKLAKKQKQNNTDNS